MKYKKPIVKKIQGKMPPITTNFAPPPVERPDGADVDYPDEDIIRNVVAPPAVFINNSNKENLPIE